MQPESTPLVRIKNLPLPDLRQAIMGLGEPKFRAQQIIKWIYQKRVGSFAEMKNVAKETREKLSRTFCLEKLIPVKTIVSPHKDAVKFAFKLVESEYCAESVLLIDGERRTACLSSQLGCGLGCTFCETGRLGFIRNLTQEEIIGQLIGINDHCASSNDKLVTNIVFMGMGEALSNFGNFRSSLDIIMDEECFLIGARRITVSTAGVVPSIDRLIAENLTIGLAVSLNHYSNELRSTIMPINKKYPIEAIVEAADRYTKATGRRVTFEYVVIPGETDTPEAATALKKLLGHGSAKINLIPLNPVTGSKKIVPVKDDAVRFSERLHALGLAATVRASRGRDISGACGQLTAVGVGKQCDTPLPKICDG
jgi:23S rRNA (adenine2503-C2)-methyltransferase